VNYDKIAALLRNHVELGGDLDGRVVRSAIEDEAGETYKIGTDSSVVGPVLSGIFIVILFFALFVWASA
jgi:hypothetical protein